MAKRNEFSDSPVWRKASSPRPTRVKKEEQIIEGNPINIAKKKNLPTKTVVEYFGKKYFLWMGYNRARTDNGRCTDINAFH